MTTPALHTESERWPWVLLAVSLAVRLALALGTDLYFDETYYWAWAQRPALGYFDHPPAIAWVLALLPVRLASLLFGALTTLAVYLFARRVHGGHGPALRAAALWSTVPAGVLAGLIATPDTPLYLAWVLALWARDRERWVLTGLFAGLALLSKYPAVLLAPAFAVLAIAQRRFEPRSLLAAALGLLLFLPVVLWNAERDWVGFAFQLRHGLGGTGGLHSFAEFLGGQLLMGGPVLFPLALVWLWRGPREHALLRAACALPLLVFGLAALKTRGEANWPGMAYLSACIGVAGWRPGVTRWAAAAGALVVLLGASHLLFPLVRPKRDVALSRLHGWEALASLPRAVGGGVEAVFTPSYQLASEAEYYARLPAGTVGGRRSQYDLWGPPPLSPGADAVWLSEGPPPPDELAQRFTRVAPPLELPATYAGRTVHTFRVWRLEGARP